MNATRIGKLRRERTKTTTGLRITAVILALLVSFLPVTPNGVDTALAAGGAYTLDFSAADPALYIPPIPYPGGPTCPTGTGTDPIANAYHTLPAGGAGNVESLAPGNMALGQIVPFEIEITVSGDTSPEDGAIEFTAGWNTEVTSGAAFGYDETYGVICAFIDTGDGAHNDPGGDATVISFSWAWVDAAGPPAPDEIQGTFNLAGLDDGDVVVLEVWLVLDRTIPAGTTGNVPSRLVSGQTATGDTINTGNQTVPLLKVGQFFSADADLSVTKSDDPDPVPQGGRLTYTIVVLNSGPSIANTVQVVDTLDANTAFVSATADNGGTCSASGGTVTCDLGAIVPGVENQVTITVVVDVSLTAPASGAASGDGPCDGSEDLCNNVSVSSITDDPSPDNNSDSEPTGVQTSTAVRLVSFRAEPAQGGVLVAWETASEVDSLGFNLYRSGSPEGERFQINGALIPGQAPGSPVGGRYQFLDEAAAPGAQPYYWLEEIDVRGQAELHGPANVQLLSGAGTGLRILPLLTGQ
jgi:uncharacterized repeat protein (TIGR01451 family)